MTKQIIPFSCEDISTLAKYLRNQFKNCERFPSHLEMLNILAQSAGHANFQHLRDAALTTNNAAKLNKPKQLDIMIPRKLQPFMDSNYILRAWPAKRALQDQSLWFFWCRFQYQQSYSEQDVNSVIKRFLGFADFALIRRELCNHKLLKRTGDGRHYWRAAATPPEELISLTEIWQDLAGY